MKRTIAFLVASFALATTSAHASGDEAMKHYAAGKKLLQENKPEAALAELDASLKILKSPNTSLLRAHALRLSNRRPEALEAYEDVIEAAGAQVRSGEKRFEPTLEEAGKWAATLRAALGVVVVIVRGADEHTEAIVASRSIAGKPASEPGATRYRAAVEPGDIEVDVTPSGGKSITKRAAVSAGGEVTVRFDDLSTPSNDAAVAPQPAAPASSPAPSPFERPDAPRSSSRMPPTASLVLGGVGVVGVVGFAVFGSMAHAKKSELDACSPSCPTSLESEASAGKRDQAIADVALFAGAAALAAGAVVWIVRPGAKKEAPSAAITIAPAWVGVRAKL